MFIGHLPAGYILSSKLLGPSRPRRQLFIGLFASLLPDFDLFYFYLIDGRQTLHHAYWTHIPFFWFVLFCFTLLVRRLPGVSIPKDYIALFFLNVFLHLFLDTIVGRIHWLLPFSNADFYFFEVPAVYEWWVLNFVLHYTFLLEIVVIIWAITLLRLTRKRP